MQNAEQLGEEWSQLQLRAEDVTESSIKPSAV